MHTTPNSASISVIIPVFREQENIGPVLANVLDEQTCKPAQVIVADGDPEAATLAAVQRSEPVLLRTAKGRATQMNAGARAATGDVLLFLHADTRLPARGLEEAQQALASSGLVAGAFRLRIDSSNPIVKMVEQLANIRTWLNRIPFGDQAIFVRAEYFYQAGGFPEIPLMEDLEFMRRLPRRRHTLALLPSCAVTSARRWEEEGVVRCSLRNIFLRGLYRAGVNPSRLAEWYR